MNPGRINRSLNFMADKVEYIAESGGKLVAPMALGAIGGWLTNIGAQKGAFQGLAAGCLMSWALTPIGNYIARNQGEGENKIHGNTKAFLMLLGTIVETAAPILATKYCADRLLNSTAAVLPANSQWIVVSKGIKEYTFIKGMLVNIAPAVFQYAIECLRAAK